MRKKTDMARKLERLLGKREGLFPEPAEPAAINEEAPSAPEPAEIKEEAPPIEKPTARPAHLPIGKLAIPDSAYELFSIEAAVDPTGNRVTQLLGLRDDPKVRVKWTVIRDAEQKEFDWLRIAGLTLIRSDRSIYGRKLEDGALVVSHADGYTFSMASRSMELEELVELFVSGLGYVKGRGIGG